MRDQNKKGTIIPVALPDEFLESTGLTEAELKAERRWRCFIESA